MRTVTQHDYARLGKQTKFDLLPNGFLPVSANLTRTGVFTYMDLNADGTVKITRQLRHPEEVFDEASIATLMGLPATNNHPTSSLVTVENAKQFVVGWQADSTKRIKLDDGTSTDQEDYVQSKVVFFDRPTIDAITGGLKSEISLGYTCVLDETPGEWNGRPYDAIQRNIRYNHLSLVNKARGGPDCRILTDSASDLNQICDGISFEGDNMGMISLDEKEYSKTMADKDRLQAENDELKAKLADVPVLDSETFKKAVSMRVALERKAGSVLPEVALDALSEREIHEAVIKKLRPTATLDGKSDDYIAARFDVALEDGKALPETKKVVVSEKAIGAAAITSDNSDDWESIADQKRKNMINQSKLLYKK